MLETADREHIYCEDVPPMFLPPLPDEILYSTLARTADALGLTGASDCARLLYGLPRLTPTIEVPPRLDRLIPRLLPGSPLNAEMLLRDHSMISYYGAFSSPGQRASAWEAAIRGDARAAMSSLAVTTIRPPAGLRYCPSCVTKDRAASHTPFWKRIHQAPAVLLCPDHLEPLQETEALRASERIGFVSLENVLANRIRSFTPKVAASFPLLAAIAQNSVTLITAKSNAAAGENALEQFYAYLHANGWQNGKRLSSGALMAAMHETFGPDILVDLGLHHARYASLVDPDKRGSSTQWLGGLLRVRGHLRHPLAIVLTMIGIGGTIKDLMGFEPPAPASPIEKRTAPCGNPLCPEYDPPAPRPLRCAAGILRVQITCNTCGFTYTQGPNTVRRKERRILEVGALWDRELQKTVESGEGTKLGLEKRFGVDIYTIKRRAAALGIWHPRWGEGTRRNTERRNMRSWGSNRERMRARHRRRWLLLAGQAPGSGRREIGRRDEVTYAFLRSCDRRWLDAFTPLRPRGPPSKEDQSAQDQEVARLIEEVTAKLREETPCRPVTRDRISRALGSPHLLAGNRRAMPLTSAALAVAVETNRLFVKRVAELICRSLQRDGVRRSATQIQHELELSDTWWAKVLPLVREMLAATAAHALIEDDQ